MAGGLLQIVSAGTEDIFLTINPQVTFFKTVYLRYSNFSIQTYEELFDGNVDFGEDVVCTLSKNGDLVHRMYLKVDLPDVLIHRVSAAGANATAVSTALFDNLNTFSKPVFALWRLLYSQASYPSSNYDTIIKVIDDFKNSDQYKNIYTNYNTVFRSVPNNITHGTYRLDIIYEATIKFTVFANSVYDKNETTTFKNLFSAFLAQFKDDIIAYKQQLFNDINRQTTINAKITSPHYRFAWLRHIGFRLIEKISVELGGQVIDSFTSDMLKIWYELTVNMNHKNVFDKMIGDVPSLHEYSTDKKPAYSLYIPIPFWFCRYHGAALPCIALRYHDIQVSVKFRDLQDCYFFEPHEDRLPDDVNIDELVHIKNASLLVDYVYLSQDERVKFGENTLEYLVEQHQYIQYNDIQIPNFNCNLTFNNPIKEMFWVVQSDLATKTYKSWGNYGHNNVIKILGISSSATDRVNFQINHHGIRPSDRVRVFNTKFYNGTYDIAGLSSSNSVVTEITVRANFVSTDDSGYIEVLDASNHVKSMVFILNGVNIKDRVDANYYNVVQPYQYHSNSASDGIFVYSFAQKPELFQPTGTANMSVMTSKDIYFEMQPGYFSRIKHKLDRMTVKLFAKSINILRVQNGMASLEFSF
jgi:hypothetical protein